MSPENSQTARGPVVFYLSRLTRYSTRLRTVGVWAVSAYVATWFVAGLIIGAVRQLMS